MRLEFPLASLVARCETICDRGCCGAEAFDFSPIQIASFLTLGGGVRPDEQEKIAQQLTELKRRYGVSNPRAPGATIDDLMQVFTAPQIDALADEIAANLAIALELIDQSEARRAPQPKYG